MQAEAESKTLCISICSNYSTGRWMKVWFTTNWLFFSCVFHAEVVQNGLCAWFIDSPRCSVPTFDILCLILQKGEKHQTGAQLNMLHNNCIFFLIFHLVFILSHLSLQVRRILKKGHQCIPGEEIYMSKIVNLKAERKKMERELIWVILTTSSDSFRKTTREQLLAKYVFAEGNLAILKNVDATDLENNMLFLFRMGIGQFP